MTKKDYTLIADILVDLDFIDHLDTKVLIAIEKRFSKRLETYKNFDSTVFKEEILKQIVPF